MREGIHPEYKAAKIVCACGNVIETRSTHGDFHVEICSNCHPFFTGKQKIMDTAGRIERFKNRYAAPAAGAQPEKPAAAKKAAPAPAAAPAKKGEENRAARRAKAAAGKPRKESKPAEAPAAEAAEAEPKGETPSA